MQDWFFRLLGIQPGQDSLQADRVFFVQPWPIWLAAIGLVAALLWVGWFYARDGRRPSWPWKALMGLLRVGAVLLVVVLLWQPMLRSHRVDTTRSIVAVVLDESASMGIRDRWQNARRRAELVQALGDPRAATQTRAEAASALLNARDARLIRDLLATHDVRVYRFGAETRGAEVPSPDAEGKKPVAPATPALERVPLAPIQPRDEQTRLGNTLDFILQDTAGQPVAGVLLVSDGGHNMGEDPTQAARRAGEARVPVFALGMGDPTPPQDVAVASLIADDVVRKGDEVVVSVALRQRGYSGRRVPVTLTLDGRTVARETVALGKEGEKQEVNLTFVPDSPGARTLRVSVPAQGEELSLANNARSWPIRIIDKKLKILLVEGRPRWEYRYLKNAILRDRTTLFSCILVDADPSLGGEGNVMIYGFPRDRKELFDFDIVILGDVPRAFFSQAQLKNLKEFVTERGGSLVTIAGELFMPWQYRGTELDEVLPVQIPTTQREILFRDPFQLELTEAGSRNPMMFLVPNVDLNRNLWHGLPGMYWCGVADRAKPGATVLAVHPKETGSDGKIPLMAVQQVGEGTSFMTMVDSTWQWRFRVGDQYFYRFWGQVIRSLTPHELPGANRFLRLTTDRTTYTLGEKVVLRARLLTPNFLPVRAREVQAEMLAPDGQRFPVRLEPVPGAAGVYSGEWLPARPGSYRSTLIAPGGQRAESTTSVVVETTSLELEEPQQHEALLRRIAALSGGQYLAATDLASLPGRIPDRRQEVRTRIEHALWDAPLGLILFMTLLIGEWVLRKRKGLL